MALDFRWPDQINLQIYGADQYVDCVASLIQLRHYSQAEALLLSSSNLRQESHQYLSALLQIRQSRVAAYSALSQSGQLPGQDNESGFYVFFLFEKLELTN